MSDETKSAMPRGEGCLYGALAIIGIGLVTIGTLGEWVILALGALVGIGLVLLTLWGGFGIVMWAWRFVVTTRLDFEERRQNMAIQAAMARSQLLLEDKRSNLVYAQDGFMPIAYTDVSATNNARLLELAAQRIDTLRLPENVPNHFHYVANSDTEQTLNQGASIPGVTGNLGDLNFLTPGSQSGKFRLIEDGEDE